MKKIQVKAISLLIMILLLTSFAIIGIVRVRNSVVEYRNISASI